MQYFRYSKDRGWVSSSAEAFHLSHCPDSITSLYVHGNRIRPEVAKRRGVALYEELASTAAPNVPVRQVIWSWPSRRMLGPIRDVRAKAKRTSLESYLLGSWVSQFSPEDRISLVGFSFGARVITGALHLLAGGTYGGYALNSTIETRPMARVVAIAAAIDSDWLHPQGCHGMACQGIDKMLLMYNPRDIVLRRFDILRPGKAALGAKGPSGHLDPCMNGRFEKIDASCIVGSRHSWQAYVNSPMLMCRLIEYTLWLDDRPSF